MVVCAARRGVLIRRGQGGCRVSEEFGHGFFQRPVFDTDVFDCKFAQKCRERSGDVRTWDTQFGTRWLSFEDLAKVLKILGKLGSGELDLDHLVLAETVDDLFERTIVLDLSLVDDDRPLAQRLDILHVVAGQQYGDLAFFLVVLEKLLHFALGDDIKSYRGFVQQQQIGAVEQRRDQFHPHPFTQGQFSDGLSDQITDFEQFGQFVDPAIELVGFNPVDLLVQPE